MKKERCVESKGFNLDTDGLAAKGTGCAGILAMGMFVMIVCQSGNTQQHDVTT